MSETQADVVDTTIAAYKTTAAKENSKVMRNKWMSLVGRKRNPDDPYVSSFPFLEAANTKDLVLASLCYLEKPYLSPYGNVVTAWDAMATTAAKECILGTGEPVFNPAPKGIAIHKRFDDLMDFVKSHDGKVPVRSGDDDEAPPSELLQFLESCYEEKSSHEDELNCKKESQAEKIRKSRAAGENFRKAALGEDVRNNKDHTKNKRVSISSSTPSDTEEADSDANIEEVFVTPKGRRSVGGGHLATLRNLGELAAERVQTKTLKNKTRKQK
jgi:hypothetical protein